MLPDKPIKVMAAEGKMLPLFYDGSIIFIGTDVVEIDVAKLKFEPKAQLEKAIADGDVVEVEEA